MNNVRKLNIREEVLTKMAGEKVSKMSGAYWIILILIVFVLMLSTALAYTGLDTSIPQDGDVIKEILLVVIGGFLVAGILIFSAIRVMRQGKKKNE